MKLTMMTLFSLSVSVLSQDDESIHLENQEFKCNDCVQITKCNHLVKVLNLVKKGDRSAQEKLLSYHCGFAGAIPKVCCDFSDVASDIKNETEEDSGKREEDEYKEKENKFINEIASPISLSSRKSTLSTASILETTPFTTPSTTSLRTSAKATSFQNFFSLGRF